jgi:hypothetical protein
MEQAVDLGFGVSFVKILRRVLLNLMMAWNWAFGMGRALNKLLGMVCWRRVGIRAWSGIGVQVVYSNQVSSILRIRNILFKNIILKISGMNTVE